MPKHFKNNILISQIILCIKELRKDKKITLEVFYFDTGIHLARIEQGKQDISISTISKICDYFEISISDFFKMLENSKIK